MSAIRVGPSGVVVIAMLKDGKVFDCLQRISVSLAPFFQFFADLRRHQETVKENRDRSKKIGALQTDEHRSIYRGGEIGHELSAYFDSDASSSNKATATVPSSRPTLTASVCCFPARNCTICLSVSDGSIAFTTKCG